MYTARLNTATYGDDVQCQIRLDPDPRDEGAEAMESWISERLLARLRHLALGYELPLLARLPSTGRVAYPEVQLVGIEHELEFLWGVVSDRALFEAISPVREMLREAARHPRGWTLMIEIP